MTTAVAGKVLEIILDESFLTDVRAKADYLNSRLEKIAGSNDGVKGVKGLGMLMGLDIADVEKLPTLMAALQAAGLIILRSGASILRIAPPLVITTNPRTSGGWAASFSSRVSMCCSYVLPETEMFSVCRFGKTAPRQRPCISATSSSGCSANINPPLRFELCGITKTSQPLLSCKHSSSSRFHKDSAECAS